MGLSNQRSVGSRRAEHSSLDGAADLRAGNLGDDGEAGGDPRRIITCPHVRNARWYGDPLAVALAYELAGSEWDACIVGGAAFARAEPHAGASGYRWEPPWEPLPARLDGQPRTTTDTGRAVDLRGSTPTDSVGPEFVHRLAAGVVAKL